MSNYRLEIMLHQYTPLLHFQGDEEGACLRASEVKPKLDKFVLNYLEQQEVSVPKSWILKSPENNQKEDSEGTIHYPALRYKMRFEKCGEIDLKVLKHPIHPLYFGKLGKGNENKVKNIFYPDGIKMTVLTTVQELLPKKVCFPDGRLLQSMRDVLDALIPTFFELHCFGTRSNKGFGSFGVHQTISADILNKLKPKCCQAIIELAPSDGYSSFYQQLNDIYVLSAMLKGGINYPYFKGRIQTALSNNMQSEKAYMKSSVFTAKEKEIYLKLCKKQNKNSIYQSTRIRPRYRFIRAMLGLTDSYSFGIKSKHAIEGKDYFTISVQDTEQDESKKITRFPNPLSFKPGDNRLLLLIYQIPDKMYEHEFTFNNMTLKTPSKDEFVFTKFIVKFLNILNNEKRPRGEWANLENGRVKLYRKTDYEEELLYADTINKLKVQNWGGINGVN